MTRARILLVEDESIIAKSIQKQLNNLGYETPAIFASGEEALARAGDLQPDLALIDIGPPDQVDGVTTAAHLRRRFDLPVVYLTAYSDEQTLPQAGITEPYSYLAKPVQEQELGAAIEMALYRHKLNRQLRTSEEKYRHLVENLREGIWAIDAEGYTTFVNTRLADMLGYTVEEMQGAHLFSFMDERGVKIAKRYIARRARGIKEQHEFEFRRKDGTRIYTLLETSPLLDEHGNYQGALAGVQDITERKQMEENLRENVRQTQIACEQALIYARELNAEVVERQRAEEQVRHLNAELEQRVADRTRELRALYEVTAVASEAFDLKTMLERLLQRVLAAIQSDTGLIHMLDETGQTLHLAVHYGLPPDIVTQVASLPAGKGLAGWVITHGEPLLSPDLAADPRAIRPNGGEDRPYIGWPMRARGRILGVLGVIGRPGQQFSVEEVALLASIADQVGVAIENARLRQEANRAAVMEERERLARDLHDSVSQLLYSMILLTGASRRRARDGRLDNPEACLTELDEIAQQALKEMRLLLYELRPSSVLEHEGLAGALQHRLDAVESRAGVEASLLVEGLAQIPGAIAEGLYHIAQEILNNVLKHAGATTVTVRLKTEAEGVTLEVADNGKGFDPTVPGNNRGGMGLLNMQQRAEAIGGSLTILSTPGHGTTVSVSVKNCK